MPNLNDIVNSIAYSTGIQVSEVKKIEELPNQMGLRHSCLSSGVTFLQPQTFSFLHKDGVTYNYIYFYCSLCGKLFINVDGMYNGY